jgi:hypothetical protein
MTVRAQEDGEDNPSGYGPIAARASEQASFLIGSSG